MADPNLTQTLQNLGTNFPGFGVAGGGGGGTPPSTSGVDVNTLLKSPLQAGDYIAKITDIGASMRDTNTGVVSIVKTAGILDDVNLLTLTAVAPFLVMPISRAWIKGNICYVSIVVALPAQVVAPVTGGLHVDICSGLPANPAGGAAEDTGIITAIFRYYRVSFPNTAALAGEGTPATAVKASVAAVSAGGVLQLSNSGYPMNGNATTGYAEYITISGHYPITLTDSTP